MKHAIIEAHFPELRGPLAFRTGHGEGSNSKAAISRAVGTLLKSINGKWFTSFTCKITVTKKSTVEMPDETDKTATD